MDSKGDHRKGGETHQTTAESDLSLTTKQGTVIADNQNSLRSGARGPTLLKDSVLPVKITHFDHERIPERMVHARGSGAHGYFHPLQNNAALTRAGFLQDPKKSSFVRPSRLGGSTVALKPDTTVQADLHGGCAPWHAGLRRPTRTKLDRSVRCGVLVVGAGITGSLMAEHLTALGHDVCLIDRERPGYGSTAASTAMLQWEIDCSLTELTGFYGFDRAAVVYRRSLEAVSGLTSLVGKLGLDCVFRSRSSLYLAGDGVGARELRAEHELRARAGLPGVYLDYATLRHEFAVDREAAILSPGSADADPLRLSHALTAVAAARGATIFDAEAVSYESTARGVLVGLDSGHAIEAGRVVLATGYVMPDFLETDLHTTSSSWAVATPAQAPDARWRDGVLIWEASDEYLYARTTADNRIVIGGEDDSSIVDPAARDALMLEKAKIILGKLKALCPKANATADFIWSGAFGETTDGLPLIGAVPGRPRLFAAYGYGGNGITFSFLASRMIGRMIAGEQEPWFRQFAVDRPAPKV